MESRLRLPVGLVVDDDPQVLKLLVRGLKAQGFHVVSAHSREEAEQAGQGLSSLDVLVTDIFLGDGWGGELAYSLKADWPGLAVVFISGETADDPVLRHGIESHMVFLEKPFTLFQLAEAVEAATGAAQTPDLSKEDPEGAVSSKDDNTRKDPS